VTDNAKSKKYDLEERTFEFTRQVIELTKSLPRTIANIEVIKQLVRSSGSVGANYIEANGALGKKDFAMRIRMCRKESKESRYWLRLLEIKEKHSKANRQKLIAEATELTRIFGAILEKTK
jgi:four helix bundle protein